MWVGGSVYLFVVVIIAGWVLFLVVSHVGRWVGLSLCCSSRIRDFWF